MSFLSFQGPVPPSQHDVGKHYEESFDRAVANGDVQPFVWPYRGFGSIVLLLYLLLPPNSSRFLVLLKFPVFYFFAAWSVRAILETKSRAFALGYAIGLANLWGIVWVAALFIFNDGRTQFRRIVGDEDDGSGGGGDENGGSGNEAMAVNGTAADASKVSYENGSAHLPQQVKSAPIVSGNLRNQGPPRSGIKHYRWQGLPQATMERIAWVVDCCISFRGAGFNHQIRSIPGPPQYVTRTLRNAPPGSSVVASYPRKRRLLKQALFKFLFGYIVLDILKSLMMHDPYFSGYVIWPAPDYFPRSLATSKFAVKFSRLIITIMGVRYALEVIFSLSPLVFVGLLGERWLGARADSWVYPDYFGSFANIFTGGLAGWWGSWWHQIFRFGIGAPAACLIRYRGWDLRDPKVRAFSLFSAFALSGLLHAAGSYTTMPDSRPMSGAFLFFVLQAFGILGESSLEKALMRMSMTKRVPNPIKGLGRFIAVMTWMYFTAPIIADDFTRSGIWHFDPVPISMFRNPWAGKNDHWLLWRGENIRWHRADKWWQSGIIL